MEKIDIDDLHDDISDYEFQIRKQNLTHPH